MPGRSGEEDENLAKQQTAEEVKAFGKLIQNNIGFGIFGDGDREHKKKDLLALFVTN